MRWLDTLIDRRLEAAIERRIEKRMQGETDALPPIPPSVRHEGIGEVNPNCKFILDVKNLNACPEFAARIAHMLIHDPIFLGWDQMFPETSTQLRQMLREGTMPDAYLEKINERFRLVALGMCGKATTVDDLKCAMMKVASSSEVK